MWNKIAEEVEKVKRCISDNVLILWEERRNWVVKYSLIFFFFLNHILFLEDTFEQSLGIF